jgi:hypothetical protein
MTDVLARTRLRICAGRRVRPIGALFSASDDGQTGSGTPAWAWMRRNVSTSAGMADQSPSDITHWAGPGGACCAIGRNRAEAATR